MVSVIIPVYNAEKTIKRAIDSVLNQTLQDFEIVIVNDGSTDSTFELCEECANHDERIHIINKKNGGVSSARNYGLKKAIGELIAFLDADDEYQENFLYKMTLAINQSDADIAVCGYYSIFPDGKKVESDIFKYNITLDKNEAIRELIIGSKLSSHPWNKIYHKHVLKNIIYPENMVYEDLYVMPDIINACSKVCFVADRLIMYIQNQQSITHNTKIKKEYDAFVAALRRYDIYKDKYIDLYGYLTREPTEIALRIYSKKYIDSVDIDFFRSIEKQVCSFLREMHWKKEAYKYIQPKYKILLLFYQIMEGKFK